MEPQRIFAPNASEIDERVLILNMHTSHSVINHFHMFALSKSKTTWISLFLCQTHGLLIITVFCWALPTNSGSLFYIIICVNAWSIITLHFVRPMFAMDMQCSYGCKWCSNIDKWHLRKASHCRNLLVIRLKYNYYIEFWKVQIFRAFY